MQEHDADQPRDYMQPKAQKLKDASLQRQVLRDMLQNKVPELLEELKDPEGMSGMLWHLPMLPVHLKERS